MKNFKLKSIFICISITFFFTNYIFAQTVTSQTDNQICYSTYGCFPIPKQYSTASGMNSTYTKIMGDMMTYLNAHPTLVTSSGFTGSFSYPWDGTATWEFVNNVLTRASCTNGVSWLATYDTCANGTSNYPTCNQCASNSVMSNNQCICKNGATDSPSCLACPAGNTMVNGVCGCANAASNPPACNVCATGSNMVNGICTCSNGAIPQSSCTQCPAGQAMYQNQCIPAVTFTNVCGQTIQGVTVNGKSQTLDGSDPNSSCISNFRVSSNTVNPNGSVEFSWSIPTLPANITSKCGFVDLTTPTPRPIPGLQNLDPQTQNARISNIQTTTRFCLICQFYSLLNSGGTGGSANSPLGNAAVHQWVRVIRIGEN